MPNDSLRGLVNRWSVVGIDPAHGVLRLSFAHCTHPDEVERAIMALDAVP